MPTAATAFAQTTKISTNPVELRTRVLSLYRQFVRRAPVFAELYEIDQPVSKIRTKLRQEFERNRFVEDNGVANILHAKGQMEFQETINFWKQQPHVLKYFQDDEKTIQKEGSYDYVSRFIKVCVPPGPREASPGGVGGFPRRKEGHAEGGRFQLCNANSRELLSRSAYVLSIMILIISKTHASQVCI
jgi:NADH dehydrogenase (ubiquinone) 1 alpha subcomplex subunit 6